MSISVIQIWCIASSLCLMVEYALAGAAVPIVCRSLTFVVICCCYYSPSYVSEGCDLEAVCNRIAWTKYKNAGQTCISVDYILVQASVEVSLHWSCTPSTHTKMEQLQNAHSIRIRIKALSKYLAEAKHLLQNSDKWT